MKPQCNNKYVNVVLDNAIEVLKQNGATIIEIDYIDKINALGEAEFEVLQFEFKEGLNHYLSTSNSKIKTLLEVIDFNKSNEDKLMPYFKQETLESSNLKLGLDQKGYKEALNKSFNGSKKILDSLFKTINLMQVVESQWALLVASILYMAIDGENIL